MEQAEHIRTHAETLRRLMAKQLGLRHGPLSRRLAKAGRRLPTGVRKDISLVAEAEEMARNPRLALRLDTSTIDPAFDRAAAHLRAIDVADRRKGLFLSILGSVAFNILAVIVLLIVMLRWRGLA